MSPPPARNWTEAEDAILRAGYLTLSDKELAAQLAAIGSTRSPVACNRRRLFLNLYKPKGAPQGHTRGQTPTQRAGMLRANEALKGWPSMRGSDEFRDWEFSQMVIAEQLRLVRLMKEAA